MTIRLNENELKAILSGCLMKERASQQLLYKSCYGFAMGICLRYSNSKSGASEILNTGFLKVFMHLD